MIKQLQAVLDRQAAALQVRDPNIKSIRNEFDQLLHSLTLQTTSQVATIDAQLQAQLRKQQTIDAKNKEIDSKLAEVNADLKEINTDSAHELELEIAEIDKQLELLTRRKQDLLIDLKNHNDSINERRSLAHQKASALEAQRLHFDDTRLSGLEHELSDSKRELDASIQGHELWSQVVALLDDLDAKTTDCELVDALTALETAAQLLFSHIEHAKSMQWNLLVTAISHEYTIVEQALDAVRKVVK